MQFLVSHYVVKAAMEVKLPGYYMHVCRIDAMFDTLLGPRKTRFISWVDVGAKSPQTEPSLNCRPLLRHLVQGEDDSEIFLPL